LKIQKKELREDDPDLVTIYINLGTVYYLHGEYEEAERYIK
jgi:Flp pilus assembly protein TadD